MKEFFTTIPGIVISLGAILAVIVTGLLYVLGLYKKGKDGEDDRLIKILQSTVEELEKKVNKQSEDIANLSEEVEELRQDNKKYIEIFQGRDKKTEEFYQQGFEAIKLARETHDIITTVAESIRNTNSAMVKLIEIFGKSVDVVGTIAQK